MHTCACGQPLVVFGTPERGTRCVGPPDCPLTDATPRADALEWRSLIGTGIVLVSGAMALIGSLVHYLR